MSEPNLDDELVQDYLAECREHLATIETDLLAIEQGGAQIDENLVNRVFRAAHSIKGGAGFFDLSKIRELAHKTENALDLIRSRQMVPTPEVVSILLMAFDKLREMIGNHRQSNEAEIGEFVDALTALNSASLPADQRASLHQQVELPLPEADKHIQISAFDLSQARRGGKCIYLIEYDLIHDVQRLGKTPLEVFRSLIQCGTILETVFDLDSAGTLDDEPSNRLMLEVLYATVLEPDIIGQVVEAPPERVRLIEKNGESRPLAAPPAKRKSRAKSKKAAPVALQPVQPVPPAPTPAPVEPVARAVTPAAPPVALPTAAPAETTIRLNVTLLDSLMTLAGELVLGRNQLNESLSRTDERGIRSGAQRVSLVTSELQEVVTQTRMQPVGGLFAKFPRLVRDLARDLGKEVQLKLEGNEVEIDKTILEGLSDPLTHMVRNAVDHAIELPAARIAAGKAAMGTVALRASHQAGQVVIEISDDGKGLAVDKIVASSVAKGNVSREQAQAMSDREKMALIFLPGVSTAAKLSDVSGRGVGMDVVKTNLDRLGGKIDIESNAGKGCRFRIKLPLTLAIIPSLLVSDSGERFAIPQVSVGELIRIGHTQIAQRIDRVGDAEVLNLRDRMVPLVYLADALGIPRRQDAKRALNVVLVDTGAFEYGLVVDELHDTVEIVVKPLGRHLKAIPDYAGATILGDGRVAVILDVAGLAARAALTSGAAEALSKHDDAGESSEGERHALLLFQNAPGELCAVPIEQVSRVERVRAEQIEYLGGRRTMQYRGSSLPVVALHDAASVGELTPEQQWVVIVFESMGQPLGLLAAEPLDMVETTLAVDSTTLRQRGIAGSAVLKNRTLLILDIFDLAGVARPEWDPPPVTEHKSGRAVGQLPTVLVADDSDFFRGQVQRLAEAVGCRVLAAEDGQAAWEILNEHADDVCLVATDVEMPRLDGLALTRQIRADGRFAQLPVIALSSLAGDEEIARGMAAGVSEYQVKFNKDELTESIRKAIRNTTGERR
jgi:two-component system chemotaxis sensor kinase CheA